MQVSVCLVSSATSGSTWAFAVSADFDVDEFGNSDNADTGVQDDAEILIYCFVSKYRVSFKKHAHHLLIFYSLGGHVDFWSIKADFVCHFVLFF